MNSSTNMSLKSNKVYLPLTKWNNGGSLNPFKSNLLLQHRVNTTNRCSRSHSLQQIPYYDRNFCVDARIPILMEIFSFQDLFKST